MHWTVTSPTPIISPQLIVFVMNRYLGPYRASRTRFSPRRTKVDIWSTPNPRLDHGINRKVPWNLQQSDHSSPNKIIKSLLNILDRVMVTVRRIDWNEIRAIKWSDLSSRFDLKRKSSDRMIAKTKDCLNDETHVGPITVYKNRSNVNNLERLVETEESQRQSPSSYVSK